MDLSCVILRYFLSVPVHLFSAAIFENQFDCLLKIAVLEGIEHRSLLYIAQMILIESSNFQRCIIYRTALQYLSHYDGQHKTLFANAISASHISIHFNRWHNSSSEALFRKCLLFCLINFLEDRKIVFLKLIYAYELDEKWKQSVDYPNNTINMKTTWLFFTFSASFFSVLFSLVLVLKSLLLLVLLLLVSWMTFQTRRNALNALNISK